MTIQHKSTMRHIWPLCVIFVTIAFPVFVLSLLDGQYGFAIFSALFLSVWMWRFKQLALIFTESAIIYRGWFKTFEFPISDICRVSRPSDKGYPHDRIYSTYVFEIESSTSKARINLLWFDAQANKAFRQNIAGKFYRYRPR